MHHQLFILKLFILTKYIILINIALTVDILGGGELFGSLFHREIKVMIFS